MIDLNADYNQKEVKVFNNGEAGKVNNVKVRVEKRKADEPSNRPDYNVIYIDGTGAEVSQGWYHFSPKAGSTAEKIASDSKQFLGRLIKLTKSVVGDEVVFPPVANEKEALDKLMTLIRENQTTALVNVFVTYGNQNYPKRYLELRWFDFIEPANTPETATRLRPKPVDMMVRMTPDEPSVSDMKVEDAIDLSAAEAGTTTDDGWLD